MVQSTFGPNLGYGQLAQQGQQFDQTMGLSQQQLAFQQAQFQAQMDWQQKQQELLKTQMAMEYGGYGNDIASQWGGALGG